jgi:hypothetical protein
MCERISRHENLFLVNLVSFLSSGLCVRENDRAQAYPPVRALKQEFHRYALERLFQ